MIGEPACRPQKLQTRRSRGLSLKTIFVMKTAERRHRRDLAASWKRMAVRVADAANHLRTLRKSRPQARMWPAAIVVRDPLPQNRANVPFVERNDEVKAFATDRPNHAFAERVRLWSAQAVF